MIDILVICDMIDKSYISGIVDVDVIIDILVMVDTIDLVDTMCMIDSNVAGS